HAETPTPTATRTTEAPRHRHPPPLRSHFMRVPRPNTHTNCDPNDRSTPTPAPTTAPVALHAGPTPEHPHQLRPQRPEKPRRAAPPNVAGLLSAGRTLQRVYVTPITGGGFVTDLIAAPGADTGATERVASTATTERISDVLPPQDRP